LKFNRKTEVLQKVLFPILIKLLNINIYENLFNRSSPIGQPDGGANINKLQDVFTPFASFRKKRLLRNK